MSDDTNSVSTSDSETIESIEPNELSITAAHSIATSSYPPPPPPQKQKNKTPLILAIAAVCGFLGGIVGVAANNTWDLNLGSRPDSNNSSIPITMSQVGVDDQSIGQTQVAQVINALTDSVVTISAEVSDATGNGEAVGTGVVITSDGEILTNAHVVEGATKEIGRAHV